MQIKRIRAAAAYLGAFLLFSTVYAAHADVVTDWNQTAIRATEIAGSPPPLQSRVMAMVHAAIFDVVNGIEHKYSPYAVDVSAASGASADAAAAAAAHGVLERLYPPQKAITDAALAALLTRIPEGSARTDGLRLGQEIAAQEGCSCLSPIWCGSIPMRWRSPPSCPARA